MSPEDRLVGRGRVEVGGGVFEHFDRDAVVSCVEPGDDPFVFDPAQRELAELPR